MKITPTIYTTKTDDGLDYTLAHVVIKDMPDLQRIPFEKWLIGQSVTMVNDEMVAFYWDYEMWYDSWIKSDDSLTYRRSIKLDNVD